MNDRFDDEQLGESVGESVARNARRVAARPNADDLFARVGIRAARQRRSLAAAGVALVAVASLVAYSVGMSAGSNDSPSVAAPRGESEPVNTILPDSVSSPVADPVEHVFTRSVNGITVRVYTSPPNGEPNVSPGFIVAEMSNDVAVGVGRAENCYGMGLSASGTFGGPEGAPVEWVIVQSFDLPSTAGIPVRAEFGSGTDEMVPVGGIAVLVAPGEGGTVSVSGAGVDAATPVGQVIESGGPMCQPSGPPTPPAPATLPPAGPQPADVASAEAGVRQAYADVYDNWQPGVPAGPVPQALREAGFTDEQLAAMTVEIGEIRFTDETHAAVLFRLTIPGHMDGTQEWRLGYAVSQDGRWTQAQETNCDDLRSINVTCP